MTNHFKSKWKVIANSTSKKRYQNYSKNFPKTSKTRRIEVSKGPREVSKRRQRRCVHQILVDTNLCPPTFGGRSALPGNFRWTQGPAISLSKHILQAALSKPLVIPNRNAKWPSTWTQNPSNKHSHTHLIANDTEV